MKSLIKIYLKYIGGAIGLIFLFLAAELIITGTIADRIFEKGSGSYESQVRQMGIRCRFPRRARWKTDRSLKRRPVRQDLPLP